MRNVFTSIAIILLLAVVAVLAHFAVIEIGNEVVELRTRRADGSWQETRLWIVDYDGSPWLHSTGADWEMRFADTPQVELVRDGKTLDYVAIPDRRHHAAIDDALREKYGLADQWVRFLAPCEDSVLPVRLNRVSATP